MNIAIDTTSFGHDEVKNKNLVKAFEDIWNSIYSVKYYN